MTSEADERWDQLLRAHAGHPSLERDTIYVLPQHLVETIAHRIPAFLTDDERRFENDLATSGASVFFSAVACTCRRD